MADEANINEAINFASTRFRDFCQRNPDAVHQPISKEGPARLDPTADDNHIPAGESSNGIAETPMQNTKCCCGRSDCAYLKHNNTALGGLEKDLETAARLGQALLDRHEAYVRDSQAEQARLSDYIHDLEDEKTSLQDANHRMVVENRELLQKLEHLNTDFGQSGKRVQELESLLSDCEQEIRRLNGLTRKAQELELQVLTLERERSDMTRELHDGKFETRSTIARWRDSERKVRQLEQEVQKIEWAARVDREKHEEIVASMGRDRTLYRELGLSEGRLKAAAAVQTMQHAGPQKQVVSNFVRDILQDNASLQAGVAELRGLLQTSNDEIEQLREQVLLHQPMQDASTPLPLRTLSLGDELSLSHSLPPNPVQQAVHVHHHYHTKLGSKKEKMPARRISRRTGLMPYGTLSPSPASSGSSTPLMRPQRQSSNSSKPVSIKLSSPSVNRWSMQSTATVSTYFSSMASSPTSYGDRNDSVFDRVETEEESSRPTSPESFNVLSPVPFNRQHKLDDPPLSVFEEETLDLDQQFSPTTSPHTPHGHLDNTLEALSPQHEICPMSDLTPKQSMNPITQAQSQIPAVDTSIPAESVLGSVTETSSSVEQDGEMREESQPDYANEHNYELDLRTSPMIDRYKDLDMGPSLRRSNSHESLMSISGMDIHLAQSSSRSTLALLQGHNTNKHYFAPAPASLRQASIPAAQTLAAVTEYTAISRPRMDPSPSASVLALNGIRPYSNRTPSRQDSNRGLIGSVGGWVSSRWGRGPPNTRPGADLRSALATINHASPTRPAASHHATSPLLVKSGNAAAAPFSPPNGKRSASTNELDIPKSSQSLESTTAAGSLNASIFFGRPPGINQSGPIPGFAAAIAARKAPTAIDPPKVDLGGLKESLAEQQ